ncbi:hypothetical protein [Spirosoma gilvum]
MMYDMAIGFVLAGLQEEHPDWYATQASQPRRRSRLVNKVRVSVDAMVAEMSSEYYDEPKEEE